MPAERRAGRIGAVLATSLVAALIGCGGSSDHGPASAVLPAREPPTAPSTVEQRYIAGTANVLFRRAAAERTPVFLFSGADGHGICIRPVDGEGTEVLLVLQRRIADDFISQVDDDVLIMRDAAETEICRSESTRRLGWVPLNA